MKPLFSTALLCLLLSACGTQIQLTHIEPTPTDLIRGTSLSVSAEDNYMADAMISSLESRHYYHLRPDGEANLHIGPLHYETTSEIHHTCTDPEECTCTPDYTEIVSGTAFVSHRTRPILYRSFSGSASTVSGAKECMADSIAEALVPHAVTHSFSINPASGNERLEAAARACAEGNWPLGRTLATHALKNYPADPEGHFLMGLIERQAENWEQAISHLRRAVTMRSNSTEYREALVETIRLQSAVPQARKQLRGPLPPPSRYIRNGYDGQDDSGLPLLPLMLDTVTHSL